MTIILYILIIATALQLFYFFFFYVRILFYRSKEKVVVSGETVAMVGVFTNHSSEVPVSVIVCACNELENLKRLIPALLQQQYKNFELILADDRSSDGSFDYFKNKYSSDTRFKIIRVEENKEGLNPKKYALNKAIEEARHEILLFTDADCTPASAHWISLMAASLGEQKEIVLGYSPYEYRKGFLNSLIRYETLHTAVNYFSYALAGIPYMGVGRNLLYKKSVFVKNKGFSSHLKTTGGDDDLFIREVAKKGNVGICLDKDSYMISLPKESYSTWFRQKRRHLSVGSQYKWLHKFLLGTEILSHGLFYLSLGALFCFDYYTGILFLMIRSLVFVVIFVLIARKLADRGGWLRLLLPIDIVYIFNNLIITLSLVVYKKIRWS